uniref:Uncharacterized protein n=1 Tax=Sphaerodactylus townsendi TaxID=933632 RepID=A0ACB8EV79_9SAUR
MGKVAGGSMDGSVPLEAVMECAGVRAWLMLVGKRWAGKPPGWPLLESFARGLFGEEVAVKAAVGSISILKSI